MKILLLTNLFPNPYEKTLGTYNYSRVKYLMEIGHEVKVISPICVAPELRMVFPIPRLLYIFKDINIKNKIFF